MMPQNRRLAMRVCGSTRLCVLYLVRSREPVSGLQMNLFGSATHWQA
jgi:hypothetical protein